MTVMRNRARRMGSQAPSRNLVSEAEKYSNSIEPKKSRKQRARIGGLCQQRMITKEVRHVVTSITVITANPATKKNYLLLICFFQHQ
jgi:hypothetical protein